MGDLGELYLTGVGLDTLCDWVYVGALVGELYCRGGQATLPGDYIVL